MTNRDWVDWQLHRITQHRADIGIPYDPAFREYAREALTYYRALSHREPEPFNLDASLADWFATPEDTPPEG